MEGLVEALQSLGLTEGVRLLRNTELRDDKHSTGETHTLIFCTSLLALEGERSLNASETHHHPHKCGFHCSHAAQRHDGVFSSSPDIKMIIIYDLL